MNVLLLVTGVALAVSFLVTLWLVWSVGHNAHLSADHDLSGPQKFHARPVTRIGGVGIAVAVTLAGLALHGAGQAEGVSMLVLLGCALPAFVAGVVEDLTKRVSATARLLATMLAAALAGGVLLGADRTGVARFAGAVCDGEATRPRTMYEPSAVGSTTSGVGGVRFTLPGESFRAARSAGFWAAANCSNVLAIARVAATRCFQSPSPGGSARAACACPNAK